MAVRRRRRVPLLIPFASIGDIVFLLIIFFVLTSNFIQEAHVKLTHAASVDISKMKQGTVTVSLDRDGTLWLQGQEVAVEGLEYEVAALLETKEDKLVVLKVDKDLPHELYGPVFRALSGAGAEIGLLGEKVEP
jgi:biopolymer transport protein ExbD